MVKSNACRRTACIALQQPWYKQDTTPAQWLLLHQCIAVSDPDCQHFQGQAAAKVMSPAEMAEYEEKKLKMRKAMGENLHDDVQGM